MSTSFENSLVRLLTRENVSVGGGLFISENKVITCAHVVLQALQRGNDIKQKPIELINLDFPLLKHNVMLQAKVELWGPSEIFESVDVAILSIISSNLPDEVESSPIFIHDEDLWGHSVRTFGFPINHENGVWASGICRARQGNGFIQIEDTKQTGYVIQPGFSGTPVWDDQKSSVIGLIVAAESNTVVKAAYIIPFSSLKEYINFENNSKPGKLFNVPQLPPHYLLREEMIDKTLDLIFSENRGTVFITSAQQTTLLQGMGGIGKTVIASAIARNNRIRNRFVDGIIWITFGQQVDIIQKLLYVGQCLDDDLAKYTTYSSAKIRLSEILAEKSCLLLLDDLWDITHIDVFTDIIGPHCRILVTTRDAKLATSLGTHQIGLDVLDSKESMKLLADWSNLSINNLPIEALSIVEECGYLPFAIALCGAMVRDGSLWVDLLDALRDADLSFIEAHFPNYPYPNILRALKVSLDVLDENSLAHYKTLAVFAEDAKIPEDTILLLWLHLNSTSPRNGRKLLSDFDRKSLLRLEGQTPHRFIRLHDLNHDYLLTVLGTVIGLHEEILVAYKTKCADGWYSGPDDGYFFDYLAYHLIQAGKGNELVATIKDMRYIARKSYLRNSLAVETDATIAQKYDPNDAVLEDINRLLANTGYLLDFGQTLNEVSGTLYEKVKYVNGLRNRIASLKSIIKPPFIESFHALPDKTHPGLIRTIFPHSTYIWRCSISADGYKVASASSDGTVKVSTIQGGAILTTLKGHAEAIRDCTMYSDDQLLMSVSDDKTVKIWDIKASREVCTLFGHTQKVNACVIESKNNLAASVSDDRTVKIWDLKTNLCIATLSGHDGPVLDCCLDKTGKRLVSASEDQTLKIWDINTKTVIHTLVGHNATVTGCSFSPNESIILSSSSDGYLILWNASTGDLLKKWKAHMQPISACNISHDGMLAISSSGRQNILGDSVVGQIDYSDHTVRLWDLNSQKELQIFHGHSRRVTDCQISPDGATIVSTSRDGTLKVWDALNRDSFSIQEGHKDWIHSCKVSLDGDFVVTSSDDSTLRIWNAQTGKTVATLMAHESDVNDCAFSKDGRKIISASRDTTAKVWDFETGNELLTFSGHTHSLRSCAVSPSSDLAATGSLDGSIKIWGVNDAIEVQTLEGHSDQVRGCTFSNSGKFLISCSNDKTLKIWNVANGENLSTLTGHTDEVCRCALASDDSFIVSSSADNSLKVWSLESGELHRTLTGHRDEVRGCAILPDQRHVISTSLDRSLKLWDIQTGSCITSLYLNDQLLNCACFPDGQRIVAVGTLGVYFLKIHW
jgi:WD40 repeat protein